MQIWCFFFSLKNLFKHMEGGGKSQKKKNQITGFNFPE